MMVTGDHPTTAVAIARQVGIITYDRVMYYSEQEATKEILATKKQAEGMTSDDVITHDDT
jgi:magnesium-transporting ATPase (P-type)